MAHIARSVAVRARGELAERSISISVRPPPVTFAERRSILQALEQHGPVEFFKPVPGQDSTFISLMKESEAVTNALHSSPIKCIFPTPETSQTTAAAIKPAGTARSSGDFMTTIEKKQEASPKEFTIEVYAAPEYRHHVSTSSTLNRPWPDFVEKNDSFISKTLEQSLPGSMAAKGLKHWDPDLGKQPTLNSKMHERFQLRHWIPSRFKPSAVQHGRESIGDTELQNNVQPSQGLAGQPVTSSSV
ncbi:hypothetical protein FZEAL_10791 [Fusarium zealandicum]|uniref:Uncharacterized protein n=1 Tax=Fusarium zealandicum TaxID=1053134 RepID=A0A8H4TWH6_9HYPO|nr:hypothetical protein FZEAL_10791 [Fusarium zealandicum]